jgi:glutamine amidotransferase
MKENPKVSIIDYGIGNLFSVLKACEAVGLSAQITDNGKDIESSDAILLPGVGAFGDAMANLAKLDLVEPIRDFAQSGKPLMGVCLGMQLLLTESEEFDIQKGLNIIEGSCVRFPSLDTNQHKIKVPQIMWNTIYPTQGKSFEKNTPLENIMPEEYMYFVHSYYAKLQNPAEVLSLTDYHGVEYCSSIHKGNVFAFQFHPEKSGTQGLKIYQKFKELILNN